MFSMFLGTLGTLFNLMTWFAGSDSLVKAFNVAWAHQTSQKSWFTRSQIKTFYVGGIV